MAKQIVIGESDPFKVGAAVRKSNDPNRPITNTERAVLLKALENYLYQQMSLRTLKKAWNEVDYELDERIAAAKELKAML